MKRSVVVFGIVVLLLGVVIVSYSAAQHPGLTPVEELGQFLYFDENLSEPAGQSCASCHDPDFGFADPDQELPVSEGVVAGLFGGRNSPSSSYAMYAPIRHIDAEGLYVGGQFWDSRATGEVLGDPLADQALGPFLNPVEMNNPDIATVIRDVRNSEYADLFRAVWGPGSLAPGNELTAYDQVALSIASFERTMLFGQFSSKYDDYLRKCLQMGGDPGLCATGADPNSSKSARHFTQSEWRGMLLFMGENNNDGVMDPGEGAMCSACHVADWTADPGNVSVPGWAPEGLVPPVFADFTYDNLGVPKNEEFPLAGAAVDLGLGAIVGDVAENGKFKVVSLRNLEVNPPYAHNGLFKSLEEITHFYNTRDVVAEGWDPPEYPDTVNVDELGNLGLSAQDEQDLVAFIKTLTDGYKNPKRQ
jgi:cytochrome c peroxidase